LAWVFGWSGGVSGNSSCSPCLAGVFFAGLGLGFAVLLAVWAFDGLALGLVLAGAALSLVVFFVVLAELVWVDGLAGGVFLTAGVLPSAAPVVLPGVWVFVFVF
jgi:hypothetical protein